MGFWPMKCALGWDFYQRLWAAMSLPLLLIFIVLLYTLVRGRVKGEAQWLDTSFLTGCSVMIVYLMFPSSTKSLLEGGSSGCKVAVLYLFGWRWCIQAHSVRHMLVPKFSL